MDTLEVYGGITGGTFVGFDTAHCEDLNYFDMIFSGDSLHGSRTLKTRRWIEMETWSIAMQIASVDAIYINNLVRCQRIVRLYFERRRLRIICIMKKYVPRVILSVIIDGYLSRAPVPIPVSVSVAGAESPFYAN